MGNITEVTPKSLRDAFMIGEGFKSIPNANVLQIEEIREFFEKDSPYMDLVEFETDIALVCELVILFCESPGSFTELGCFSMVEEIYEKILVIIQNQYLSRSTFISKGPVANFKRLYDKSVFSIVDAIVGIYNNNIANLDINKLISTVSNPISSRLGETLDRTTLDISKFNHLCKIYVALLKEFYSLKDDEIILLLLEIGFEVNEKKLDRVAFCCRALKWSGSTTVGFDRVHYAIGGTNEAARFEFEDAFSDKIRRRMKIRQFWESNDPARVAAVSQELQ